jgi:glycosyltransferase involved in cell wall biosynthesis
MKIAAITTFPPSKKPLNSFGYYAVLKFLQNPDIKQLIVLADVVENEEEIEISRMKLHIERCWNYNSVFSQLKLLKSIHKHNPDVIWLNLQYTTFGITPLSMFFGMLIPAYLKLMGFPLILTLHNYLAIIELDKMNIFRPSWKKMVIHFADKIIMRSITMADIIFTLSRMHYVDLLSKYPKKNIQFVQQDLYPIGSFEPSHAKTKNILTIGYFGTYKKLELLLDAFQIVRQKIQGAVLHIAGCNNLLAPNYLENLKHQYSNQLANVEFLGYVNERNIPKLFRSSNVVVITNATSGGSSGVVWLSATHGRALVIPYIKFHKNTMDEGWKVKYYDLSSEDSLAEALIEVLNDYTLQNQLGFANHQEILKSHGQFADAHFQAFRDLIKKN